MRKGIQSTLRGVISPIGMQDGGINRPNITVPGAQSLTTEDVPLIFSVSFSDAVDASLTVTLSVLSGTLSLSGTTGLSFSVGDGTGDATMTFSGTITNINTACTDIEWAHGVVGTYPIAVSAENSTGGTRSASIVVNLSAETTAPTVSSLSPVDNATGIAVTVNPSVTFTENVQFGIGSIALRADDSGWADVEVFDVSTDVGTGPGQVNIVGNVLTIYPTDDLDPAKQYAIRIDSTAIDDLNGNSFAGLSNDAEWSFYTVSTSDALFNFVITPAAGGTTASIDLEYDPIQVVDGTFFFVVIEDTEPAPDEEQIEAGTDGADALPVWEDSVPFASIDMYSAPVEFMTPETGHIGHCVHKSDAGVYTNIVSDAFTTLAASADPNQPIYDLFAGTAEGAWYDFSDPEMMISVGVSTSTSHKHIPALNGSVSAILDRRLDLADDGTKIVAPYTGAFTASGSPGFATFTDNGSGSFTAEKTTAGGVAYAQGTAMAPIDLTVGEVYRVTYTVSGYTGVGLGYCFLGSGVNNRSTVGRDINANGTFTTYLYAHTTQANATLVFGSNSNSWGATISNVSIAKVLGNHARLGATTATLRQDGGGRYYVEFDSTDRFYTPFNINLGANDNLLICQPHLRSQNAASARLFQHGATVQINGHSPDFSTGDEYKFTDGTVSLEAQSSTTPETVVWTATRVKSGTASLRINGVEAESGSAGSGTLENAPLYIGSTSVPGTYFAGGMYGLLIYNAAFDGADITLVEEFMADKCGVII